MKSIKTIVLEHKKDRRSLLDMIRDVQAANGYIPGDAVKELARLLGMSQTDVLGVVTFYHFFSLSPRGKYAVYLNGSITSHMNGRAAVAAAFEKEAGCRFGETTSDGTIGLFDTSCIGMNDQEPSAIINGVIFTSLTAARAGELVAAMKAGKPVQDMVLEYGDGANQTELVRAMVSNNIIKKGPVLFGPFRSGSAVRKAAGLKPEGVIDEIKKANLLGRGGAGFPIGLKWEFCRKEKSVKHFVVCNADEGEPGTFKDRVILTELPRLLFEGMAIAGYAVGADLGILYLRAEYAYLKAHLENVLEELRKEKVLGRSIAGVKGFNFDVRIKIGAGAYICGEESAQIIAHDSGWFKSFGIPTSAGTKLLSVSGDCARPGVYEIEFGLTVRELLDLAGAPEAQAVQVGGPSGNCISRQGFQRKLAFTDLPTGGSIIIFGPRRDIFEVVRNFMEFFVEESCGWCAPCRAGNVLLLQKFEKIAGGKGTARDLAEIENWGKTIKAMSRCGLGQTSPNPILTTLQNFREFYEARVRKDADFITEFDLAAAMEAGRRGVNPPARRHLMTEIKFTIDGRECKGRPGQTIIEAAKANGVYIPALCNYEDLKPAGSCRVCTVRVGGRYMAACTQPVTEGMAVENTAPDLQDMRVSIIEMLFVEGNHMCPTCEKSGNCELQALAYRFGMMAPRFPFQGPNREIDGSASKIIMEHNRCVQCQRCVRAIRTKDGRKVFAVQDRSGRTKIGLDPELAAKLSDETAQKAMDICPVGAILKKEVGFAVPVGKRKFDKKPIGSDIEETARS